MSELFELFSLITQCEVKKLFLHYKLCNCWNLHYALHYRVTQKMAYYGLEAFFMLNSLIEGGSCFSLF